MNNGTKLNGPAALSAFRRARATVKGAPLASEELRRLDAFWRASNYLALGMIYLRDDPLLREPLRPEPRARALALAAERRPRQGALTARWCARGDARNAPREAPHVLRIATRQRGPHGS